MKVTVHKIQIAQAKECVRRLDIYDKALKSLLNNIEVIMDLAFYNKWPDDFRLAQKKSLEVIERDIKSMRAEVSHLALVKAERASDLTKERNRQLEITNNEL